MSKRRKARELALQGLYLNDIRDVDLQEILKFEWVDNDYNPEIFMFAEKLITGTLEHLDVIDKLIEEYILKKHLDRLSIIDRNILRFSIFSLKYQFEIHHIVIINEAVDLAKKFGEQNSFKLINGALDNMQKKLDRNTKNSV